MPQVGAVIFDCYGTLIDVRTDESKPEIYRFLSAYLQYYGISIDEESLKSGLQRERERFLKNRDELCPDVDLEVVFGNILRKEGRFDRFLTESCCRLFRLLSRERLQLFPDVVHVLREMKAHGYPLAMVSDAQKVFTPEECRMLGLHRFFEHVVLSTQYGFRKPDPRLHLIACSLLRVEPGYAVYIGDDAQRDVRGAKEAGLATILVDRGARVLFRETDVKPDLCVKGLWEAWDWIRGRS
ncbi:MAG: HAD family hydrolase [Dehalococcoidia bacterium]|nr:HAD family hydrolase [Dehalococcoidia bacterium]